MSPSTFNAALAYQGCLDSRYYLTGQDLAAAVVRNARASLPEGTPFSIVSYGYEDGRVGWVYNGDTSKCVVELELTA